MSHPEMEPSLEEVFASIGAASHTHNNGEFDFGQYYVDGQAISLVENVEGFAEEEPMVAILFPVDFEGQPTNIHRAELNVDSGCLESMGETQSLVLFRRNGGFYYERGVDFVGFGFNSESDDAHNGEIFGVPSTSFTLADDAETPIESFADIPEADRKMFSMAMKATADKAVVNGGGIRVADTGFDNPQFNTAYTIYDEVMAYGMENLAAQGNMNAIAGMPGEITLSIRDPLATYTFETLGVAQKRTGVNFDQVLDLNADKIMKPDSRPDQVLPRSVVIHKQPHGSRATEVIGISKHGFVQIVKLKHTGPNGTLSMVELRGVPSEGYMQNLHLRTANQMRAPRIK